MLPRDNSNVHAIQKSSADTKYLAAKLVAETLKNMGADPVLIDDNDDSTNPYTIAVRTAADAERLKLTTFDSKCAVILAAIEDLTISISVYETIRLNKNITDSIKLQISMYGSLADLYTDHALKNVQSAAERTTLLKKADEHYATAIELKNSIKEKATILLHLSRLHIWEELAKSDAENAEKFVQLIRDYIDENDLDEYSDKGNKNQQYHVLTVVQSHLAFCDEILTPKKRKAPAEAEQGEEVFVEDEEYQAANARPAKMAKTAEATSNTNAAPINLAAPAAAPAQPNAMDVDAANMLVFVSENPVVKPKPAAPKIELKFTYTRPVQTANTNALFKPAPVQAQPLPAQLQQLSAAEAIALFKATISAFWTKLDPAKQHDANRAEILREISRFHRKNSFGMNKAHGIVGIVGIAQILCEKAAMLSPANQNITDELHYQRKLNHKYSVNTYNAQAATIQRNKSFIDAYNKLGAHEFFVAAINKHAEQLPNHFTDNFRQVFADLFTHLASSEHFKHMIGNLSQTNQIEITNLFFNAVQRLNVTAQPQHQSAPGM